VCTGDGDGTSWKERVLEARLRIAESAPSATTDEILQLTLDEAERLTGGNIGFFHFLEEDGLTLSLQNWSSNTLDHMCSAEGKGLHYSLDKAGVWVDCVRQDRAVIHNDYQSLEHRRGMPDGHAPVTRELLIPIRRRGRIVAILGTGNKPTDYDEHDLEAVSLLANLAWDIVVQKRTETELRSRERDLAKAQEVAHVGSWQLDLLADRLTWSDEVYRIFGLAPQSFGATLEAFLARVHPDDREGVKQTYQAAVDNGTSYAIVHRIVRPDGEVRVVQERSEHVVDETGRVIRSLGTVLDITELYRVQEELRVLNATLEERVRTRTAELEASRAELQRLNEQKNELLGMAAHDLRNPLAAIQGLVDLLVQQMFGDLEANQLEAITRIGTSSRRMAALVDDLLDVSTIEAGRLKLECAPQELLPVVRDAVDAIQLLAGPKGIRVELTAAETLPLVRIDRGRIEQVLSNLLGNAVKFSHPGSTVEVGLTRREGCAVISVSDRGRGIAPDQAERLFQPFGAETRPGTAGERSTGLGLAIARKMVEAHGGEIWFTSELDVGSCFCVALPVDGSRQTTGSRSTTGDSRQP
jgi:PAS domain S-box-containing protein